MCSAYRRSAHEVRLGPRRRRNAEGPMRLHLAPPQPGQRQVRLPAHRLRQPVVPPLRRPRLLWPRLTRTARIGASADYLTGLNHRLAPFGSPRQRNPAAPGEGKPGTPRERSRGAGPPLLGTQLAWLGPWPSCSVSADQLVLFWRPGCCWFAAGGLSFISWVYRVSVSQV
jgi:hypothetical protein